jgi:hypothetical protein
VGESRLELGRVRQRQGEAQDAAGDWRRAVDLLAAALDGSDRAEHRTRFARALLELGDVERARPVVARLLAEGVAEPELLELCRRHGLAR